MNSRNVKTSFLYNYPPVFMTAEDQETANKLETAIKPYVERMKAEWIMKGGIEKNWDAYLKQLDKVGLPTYLALKQKYYDAFVSGK